MPTIADRGTTANIVSLAVAQRLVTEKIIKAIESTDENISIQFGVSSARVPVVGQIVGGGLIDLVYVVDDDLPISLISDTNMVDKGVVFVEDDSHLIGLAGGRVVVVGTRNKIADKTESAAMWRFDLRRLLQQKDPRVWMTEEESGCNMTAEKIADIIIQQQQQQIQHQQLQQQQQPQSLLCYGARPRHPVKHVRLCRRMLKCLAVSPYTLAKTVERDALRNKPDYLTARLLRDIGHARGNIAGILSTARVHPSGGTGIKTTIVGQCFSFDIHGKWVTSIFGCCYVAHFCDEASGYSSGYGLINKNDIRGAVILWCQFIRSCGKGPPRYARVDAASEVSKNGELLDEFVAVCADLGLLITPSAPEDQQTNFVERQWQSISHRMANMFLQQDTLVKQQWLLVWFAAVVRDRVVIHGENKYTPYELMCGRAPDIAHASAFFCGQTVMFPSTNKKAAEQFVPGHQVGIAILPILGNNAWLVVMENSSQPQVRKHVQPVGIEKPDLSESELEKLQPQIDPVNGHLVDFHSRAKCRFTLQRAIKAYDDGDDLAEMVDTNAREDLVEMRQNEDPILAHEIEPYLGPIAPMSGSKKSRKRKKKMGSISEVIAQQEQVFGGVMNNQFVSEEAGDFSEENRQQDQQLGVVKTGESDVYRLAIEASTVDTEAHADVPALTALVLSRSVDHEMVKLAHTAGLQGGSVSQPIDEEESVATRLTTKTTAQLASTTSGSEIDKEEVYTAYKARVVHTANNPTSRMLEKDPELAALWQAATHKEVTGAIEKGYRCIITDEEKESEGWIEEPIVFVYVIKRDGTRKCRAASDGSATPLEWFDPDDIFAEGLSPIITRFLTAFGAYFKMIDFSFDVSSCFSAHCTWDKSKYPRMIVHRLSAFQSPTGRPVWWANLTNNYGSRDAPGQWRMISRNILIKMCGLIASRVCDQLFMQFRGEDGLLIVGQSTDDFKVLHTDNKNGRDMKDELLTNLQKIAKWEITTQQPTIDYCSLDHQFSVIEGCGHAVTLTQEKQIEKAVYLFYGPPSEIREQLIPQVLIPLPSDWSAEESAKCLEVVTQKEYMTAVMTAAWATQTHFETSAISLLACRSHRPTQVDMAAVRHYVAYLYWTRRLGVTYYEAPSQGGAPDIRKTVALRMYTDDGENQHLDGAGHHGFLVYLGEVDNGSGAILGVSQKARGVIGESVPVNEITATLQGTKYALMLKYMLEELSGATRDDLDTTEMCVEGSAEPLSCSVSSSVVEAVNHNESGELGDPSRSAAAKILSHANGGACITAYGDNAGVINNITHISSKSKGLKRVTRIISYLRSLHQHDIVRFIKCDSDDQLADCLTKQYTSPVQNALSLSKVLGRHPLVTEYEELVQTKCNKRRTGKIKRDREEAEERQIAMESEGDTDMDIVQQTYSARPVVEQKQVTQATNLMKMGVQFLQSGKGFAERTLAMMGYKGTGGIGKNENGSQYPMGITQDDIRRTSNNIKSGIGFLQGSNSKVNVTAISGDNQSHKKGGMRIHHARVGGILDTPMSVVEEKKHPEGIFLVERLRRALMKLDPQERLLFSTRLRGGPLEDILIADEQVITATTAETQVASSTVMANTGMVIKATTFKERKKQKHKQFFKNKDACKRQNGNSLQK